MEVRSARQGTWIADHLQFSPPVGQDALLDRIERRAADTEARGAQPLWEGFRQQDATRTSEQVRTNAAIGRFFVNVVMQRRPRIIVEFGTAFGVSGMYWLGGLEANNAGHLLTFEPNAVWARIARANLDAIGARFTLVEGTFEENIHALDAFPGQGIDIGFVDAIHTSAFVNPQFHLVKERASSGALIFLDDINFSPDMRACWEAIAQDPSHAAAAEIGNVGLIELP